MSSRVLALMAATVIAPAIACGDDDAGVAFERFTSEAHRFAMDYRADWAARSGGDDDTFTAPGGTTIVLVEFGAGPETAADDPTLVETVREAAAEHNPGVADFAVVGLQTAGPHKALVVEWTQDGANRREYVRQAWIPNGDSSWYVTMTTPTETKDMHEETFQRMLDSFEPSE